MVTLVNDAEGTGTATVGSGGTNGWDSVDTVAPGTVTYDTTTKKFGTSSLKLFSGATAGNAYVRWTTSLGTLGTSLWGRTYFMPNEQGINAARIFSILTDGPSLRFITGGLLRLYNSGGSTIGTSTTVLTASQWSRIEFGFVKGSATATADGTGEVRIYTNPDSTTPTETLGPFTFATGVTWSDMRWGQSGTSVANSTHWHDSLSISEAGWIGPVSTGVPLTFPTVDATGWTVTGTDAQSALADASDLTYLTSGINPSAQPLPLTLPAMETPVGDLVVTIRVARIGNSTSGSVVATLMDGATTVATSNTVTPATSAGDVTLTFLAANISSVTQAKWRAGTLVVRPTFTAA